mmetsp:Transcript_35991/g.94695  ORF Transcript_35991/g.94695 Transcript_35991/m.94695 type:complete len:312 (+) Transcript_35991:272-1207(+)
MLPPSHVVAHAHMSRTMPSPNTLESLEFVPGLGGRGLRRRRSRGRSVALSDLARARVVLAPARADDAMRLVELGLLGERVVAEVDGLRARLRAVAAPRLTPQPFLGERVDGHDVLRVVRQVLVEVGERVGVLRERVVEDSVLVAVAAPPELVQVDDEEGGDVVRVPAQVVLPVALREEAEAGRVAVGVLVAERGHGHRGARGHLEIPQLGDVGVDDLVGVDVDDALDVQREHDIEEEDLVSPDDALLVRLLVQPRRPLVLHQLVLEADGAGHRRQKVHERGRQEVFEQPELHLALGTLDDRLHHNLEEALV